LKAPFEVVQEAIFSSTDFFKLGWWEDNVSVVFHSRLCTK
jgi:hypothetical protein